MRAVESLSRAARAVDPVETAERAVDGLKGPISGSFAIATVLYGAARGDAALSPRAMAALTAFVWHRPGPGVPSRVFTVPLGRQPKIPSRPQRPRAGKL